MYELEKSLNSNKTNVFAIDLIFGGFFLLKIIAIIH
jgi:hypothetical protein